MFFGLEILLLLVLFPFAVAVWVVWVWALVAALRNEGLRDGEKVGWVLAILFLHILGAILYFIFAHPKRKFAVAT